jgi:hypothetical protein
VAIIHRFSKTISRVGLRVGAAFVCLVGGRPITDPAVCTENLIGVDAVMESPKLAE